MKPLFFCLSILTSGTLAVAADLDAVLASLDKSAASFQGLTASLTRVAFTAVLNDKSTEKGRISMRRPRPNDLRVLIELTEPDAKSVSIRGAKAEIYYPKIKTVHEYNLGKQRNLVDQYLLLGFGTSGQALAKSYALKALGEETIGGHRATKMEMTPRSDEAKQHLKRVEMWITDAGHPIQQQFFYPSGDYMLITYSDVKWNPSLNDEAVTLRLPQGVKREFPQR
jgi:outer membrane lipoprotein-sorting protein